jgi:hypothetical protein
MKNEFSQFIRVLTTLLFYTFPLGLQGNAIPLSRFSFRILIGIWILVAMVLVNCYSSTVISYLTIPKMKPAINNFEDLANSQEVDLILLDDTMTKKQILVNLY